MIQDTVLARHFPGLCVVVCALAFGAGSSAALAQSASPEERLRDALRQTTLQLRQAQDENAELRAKQQALEQQQAAPKPQAPAADAAQLVNARRALEAKTAAAATLQQQLDDAQKALGEWQKARQEAVDLARKRDADATRFQGLYEQIQARALSCEQKNAQLYSLGNELLDRYKNKGVWDAMKDDEPFTRIHRVNLEKLAQDYHDKLLDQKVQTPPGAEDQK